jgi:hypothetical protein
MSRVIAEETFQELIQRIELLGGSANISELVQPGEARSTVLRRLKILLDRKQIKVKGKGKNTSYLIAELKEANVATLPAPDPASSLQPSNDVVPFSKISVELRSLLRVPLAARTPIGYDRAFLESYIPNESSYLGARNCARLLTLGMAISPEEQAPAGTYARQVLGRLLIDLSWNSSRLEGNTYSLLDTRRLIEHGVLDKGRDAQETQMILNHKAAIEFIVESASDVSLDAMTIQNLHALLSDNLLNPPELSGALRKGAVAIGGSVYIPLATPQVILECFQLMLKKACEIKDPFEQAFFVMTHLPYLQPFIDVNKRTSRLAANIPLIRANLCPLSFVDVPEDAYIDATLAVYEFQRTEPLAELFVWAYERSCLTYRALRAQIGQPDPFRSRYREQLIAAVGAVVRRTLKVDGIEDWAQSHSVREEEREQFLQIVTTELNSLHDGNFARFRIRPSEWAEWKASK